MERIPVKRPVKNQKATTGNRNVAGFFEIHVILHCEIGKEYELRIRRFQQHMLRHA